MCGACGENVSEILSHHLKYHSSMLLDPGMYELFEIDERVKCNSCMEEMPERDIEEHRRRHNTTYAETDPAEIRQCGFCEEIISESALMYHQTTVHPRVPLFVYMHHMHYKELR